MARGLSKKPDTELQGGARSTVGHTLNYNSVNTLAPKRLANAFTQADMGQITHQAALFQLIEEQDAHIFSELAKRKRAITSLGWHLQAPDDASEAELKRTAELESMIREIHQIEDFQYDIADGIGAGFAVAEMEWQKGEVWLPKQIHYVPQHDMELDITSNKLLYAGNGASEQLKPLSWIVHEHKSKSGYIEQSALFRVLAWTYAYKAYNVKDMQRFLELYGLPLRLGKYPAGIAKAEQDKLLKAVRNIGHDGAGIVPANMMIEFVKETNSGSVKDYLSTIQYWEEKQSKAILGGELDGKVTSEARITQFDKVRREILLHDVRQLEPTYTNQLLGPINHYNAMFKPGRLPKWKYKTQEPVDQEKMVKVLDKAAEIGLQIEVEYAHDLMQIPQAKEGAAVLGKKPAADNQDPPSSEADQALSRLAALAKNQGAEAELTDAYTAQLAALGARQEAKLVQALSAVVADAGGFDEALEGLEALAIEYKMPALVEVLAQGMTAAHLGGRSDVEDGD